MDQMSEQRMSFGFSRTPMEFQVSYTPKSLREADRMSTRWYFWPVFVVQNLQGFALVAFLLVGGAVLVAKSLLKPMPDVPQAMLGASMVIIPCLGFRWYYRREARKTAESLAAINPLVLSFTADGIYTKEKNGARTFQPWSSFGGFRQGRTVILLDETLSGSRRMIPTDSLSCDDIQRIRDTISSHLPKLN